MGKMKSGVYFEPPSRLQLLDKLKHFVRFSDFLLLVSGERGAGKSTLLAQLLPETNDTTLACCLVRPQSELSQAQLLDDLSRQLPSHDNGREGLADKLKVFHLQLKAMQAVGQKCLILVDDAEYLAEEAFDLLMNLHAANAQVLLVSDPAHADEMLQRNGVQQFEGRVHHLRIEGMEPRETQEYLQACHPKVAALPEKKLEELIVLSEGMPGRIETLLAGGKVAASHAASKPTAFPLPPLHMAGIGVVLIAILSLSLWQFLPEDDSSEVVDTPTERISVPLVTPAVIEQPTEVVEVKVPKPAEPKQEPQAASEVKSRLAERLKAQEEKLQPKQEAVKPEEPVKVVAETKSEVIAKELKAVVASGQDKAVEQAPSVSAPPVVVKEPPKPPGLEVAQSVVKPKPAPTAVKTAGKLSADEQALLKWPVKSYTLQMLGARSEKSARDFIKANRAAGQLYHFSTVYKGKPWHVVVFGEYSNRDIANAAIRKLPESLRKVKPWARSIQGVQVDIRKKK